MGTGWGKGKTEKDRGRDGRGTDRESGWGPGEEKGLIQEKVLGELGREEDRGKERGTEKQEKAGDGQEGNGSDRSRRGKRQMRQERGLRQQKGLIEERC